MGFLLKSRKQCASATWGSLSFNEATHYLDQCCTSFANRFLDGRERGNLLRKVLFQFRYFCLSSSQPLSLVLLYYNLCRILFSRCQSQLASLPFSLFVQLLFSLYLVFSVFGDFLVIVWLMNYLLFTFFSSMEFCIYWALVSLLISSIKSCHITGSKKGNRNGSDSKIKVTENLATWHLKDKWKIPQPALSFFFFRW